MLIEYTLFADDLDKLVKVTARAIPRVGEMIVLNDGSYRKVIEVRHSIPTSTVFVKVGTP